MDTMTAEERTTQWAGSRLDLMKRKDVRRCLSGHGIMGGTHSLADYEMAKQVMFGRNITMMPGTRERITRWITTYIGV